MSSVSKGNKKMNYLHDSDTNETLTASDLGITDEQYEATVQESLDSYQDEGHVRVAGHRVYAA
jgi:hypothetical protein